MRSPLDFPCPSCGVSAGRYCDGAEPCAERVKAAGEAGSLAGVAGRVAELEAIVMAVALGDDGDTLGSFKVHGLPGRAEPDKYSAEYLTVAARRLMGVADPADELSLEVLP